MKLLNDWIPENLLYALGWTLVHSVWQLILIAGLLWIALRLVQGKSPNFKYKLALSGMGLSFLVAVGTFIYEFSLFNPEVKENLNGFQVILFGSSTTSQGLSLENSIQILVNWIEFQLPILVNIWFFGALLFMFRLVNSLSELRTMRKASSDPNDFYLEKMLYRLSGKLGLNKKIPALRITQVGQSPITFGFLKPIILIPAGLIFHLSPTQLEAIIAHELAHVKRNDYLVNLLQSGLEVLFFYHPCYWWMSQTVKEMRENAADDLVVQAGISPKELAHALAEVLNFAKQNPPELALAAGNRRNPTLQRIKRILGYPSQSYPQNPIISIPMLLTLLLSAGLMASAQQDAPAPADKIKPLAAVAPAANPQAIAAVFPIVAPAPAADTADSKKEKRIIIIDGDSPIMMHSNGSVIKMDGKGSYRFEIKGDTLITEDDTIIINSNSNYNFHSMPDMDWSRMPILELAEAPVFPEGFMAAPVFPLEMLPEMAPFMIEPMAAMPPMMPMIFDFDEGTPSAFYFSDTTKMTPEEREQWAKKSEEWAKMAEMKAAEWAKKSEEWAKEFEPKMKEFELKMKEWEKANEPRMKEFELKIQEWEKQQEPKMKEFELKMEEWQKEQQPKFEEFQRKMEIWQKENAKKMEEFQRKLEEDLKKKDN